MNRHTLILVITVLSLGCRNDARSQQQAVDSAASVTLSSANADISNTRETAITRAVAAASPAVVSINVIELQRVQVRDPFYDLFSDPWFEQFFGRRRYREYERQVKGLGSGFVISSDGYIVTNDHVAGRASKITVSFPNGDTYEAGLVGTDQVTDLALLKIETESSLPFLKFSDEDALVGEWAIALGNPFGLFEASDPTVTVGVVSAVDRDFSVLEGHVYRDMIQTDASINQGNSGGPLINAVGEVIGVNTFIYSTSRDRGSIGLGFAVPAAKARGIIEELKVNGQIDRSYYTGLRGLDVNQRIAQALGLETAAGVFVQDIDAGSPADQAGFQVYDVIVGVAGESVANRSEFVARLYDFRPGDRVGFEVIRSGARRNLSMRIGRIEG